MVVKQGSGALTIHAADVTATGGSGIYALAGEATTSITLTAAATVSGIGVGIGVSSVTGDIVIRGGNSIVGTGGRGIFADSRGGGDISILDVGASGSIVGLDGDGIITRTTGDTASTTVSLGEFSTVSGRNGISATALGAGDIRISGGRTVHGVGGRTVNDPGGRGISAISNGGTISILDVGADGRITGSNGEGIFAQTTGADSSITIDASTTSAITGTTHGIRAIHAGSGAVSITAGEVTGTAGDAIHAASVGGDIRITSAHTVTGGRGIFADSDGGDISIEGVGLGIEGIDRTGGVSGTDGHGIEADARGTTEGTGGSVSIGGTTAIGSVTGSLRGINARTDGADSSITIDSSGGAVIGEAGHGIYASNAGSGGVSITAGDVTATGGIGISSAASAGETRITLGSGATVMASGGAGVSATSTGAQASISLRTAEDATTASSIIGSTDGITMVTQGADISIAELASVTGNAGDGIDATSGGGAITIHTIAPVVAVLLTQTAEISPFKALDSVLKASTGGISGGGAITIRHRRLYHYR